MMRVCLMDLPRAPEFVRRNFDYTSRCGKALQIGIHRRANAPKLTVRSLGSACELIGSTTEALSGAGPTTTPGPDDAGQHFRRELAMANCPGPAVAVNGGGREERGRHYLDRRS